MSVKKCKVCGHKDEIALVSLKANGIEDVLCQNCLIMTVMDGSFVLDNDENLIDDVTGEKGAISFESIDEHYTLEKSAMERLIKNSLLDYEYFALAEKYSPSNFMLHDDFYDPDTGEAIQPKE